MYQGYKSRLSTAQLNSQIEMLEATDGKALAAKALGFPADQSFRVAIEMQARYVVAMAVVDEECNDNGFGNCHCSLCSVSKPYDNDQPLPF